MTDRRRRWWAVVALVTLALLAVLAAAEVVLRALPVLALLVGAALGGTLALASSWWAVMTRRAWKRAASLAVLVAVGLALVVGGLAFSLSEAGTVVVAGALVLVHGSARRSALRPPAPPTTLPLPGRPWLLVNPRSGGGTAERLGLAGAARALGVDVHLLAPGDDPAGLARAALRRGADVVGVAGGDGSLAAVAAVAVACDVPFVCIPAGTRNHFAQDLGLDRDDPVGALAAFSGEERRIDVALAGDRLFLNNVSLGAYADAVAQPGYRNGKLRTARVVARRAVRGERPPLDVSLAGPGGERVTGVQVLQVANNSYGLGRRPALDAGVLQISALRARSGAKLGAVAGQVALRRSPALSAWAQWETTGVVVDGPATGLPAGVDGEAVVLCPPVEFRSLAGGLRVLVPVGAGRRRLGRAAARRLWVLALGRGSYTPTAGRGVHDAGQGRPARRAGP